MTRFAALAATLLAACCPGVPINPPSDDPPPEAHTAEAYALAVSSWEDRLGVPIEMSARVRWLEPDENGCLSDGCWDECPRGVYVMGGDIYLRDVDGPTWVSSLAHEALHMALDQYLDGDADHTEPYWEMLWDVQLTLKAWEEGPTE